MRLITGAVRYNSKQWVTANHVFISLKVWKICWRYLKYVTLIVIIMLNWIFNFVAQCITNEMMAQCIQTWFAKLQHRQHVWVFAVGNIPSLKTFRCQKGSDCLRRSHSPGDTQHFPLQPQKRIRKMCCLRVSKIWSR